MKYLVEFRVKGKGTFPFDMLRYMQAWPRTSDDAVNLAFEHPDDIKYNRENDREIELITYSNNKDWKFWPERWASFLGGWHVMSYRVGPAR